MANNHTFQVGDTVKTKQGLQNQNSGGKVRYIACGNARPSIGTCSKSGCAHDPKDYIWVLWPGKTTTTSYPYTDIELDPNAAQQVQSGSQGTGLPIPPNQANQVAPVAKEPPADTKPLSIESVVEHFKSKVKDTEVLDSNEFDWKSYNSRPVTDSKGKAKPHAKF